MSNLAQPFAVTAQPQAPQQGGISSGTSMGVTSQPASTSASQQAPIHQAHAAAAAQPLTGQIPSAAQPVTKPQATLDPNMQALKQCEQQLLSLTTKFHNVATMMRLWDVNKYGLPTSETPLKGAMYV